MLLLIQIEILASLQSIDQKIEQQQERKQRLLGELEAQEEEIRAKKQEIDALVAGFAEKEQLRLERDRFFQDEGKKMIEKRMRKNRIKNLKELRALQREIDLMQQANGELEEEIIRIMQEVDYIKGQIEVREADIAITEEDWNKKHQQLKEQIHSIDKALSQAAVRRQSIASQVMADLLSRYDFIFSRRGGTAVVEVKAGICQGCFIKIPPQLWNEIIRNESLHVCPSCQRILFVKPPR